MTSYQIVIFALMWAVFEIKGDLKGEFMTCCGSNQCDYVTRAPVGALCAKILRTS